MVTDALHGLTYMQAIYTPKIGHAGRPLVVGLPNHPLKAKPVF